jgi:hypothetical protein
MRRKKTKLIYRKIVLRLPNLELNGTEGVPSRCSENLEVVRYRV